MIPFTPQRCCSRTAFTLLELLVVVTILSFISMAILPVYVASMNGIRLRNARNDIISLIRYAQEMAVRESREHRIYFDTEAQKYRLVRLSGLDDDEKVFEAADGDVGREQVLPEYLTIERMKARKDPHTREYYISCLPNGASDQASIRLRDQRMRGSSYEILVEGPLGKVNLKERR